MLDITRRPDGQYELVTEVWLKPPPDRVFPFFAAAENLQELTPPWLHFEILTPTPLPMRAGLLIDYRIRLRGLPMRWRTHIATFEPDTRFVDEQIRGPYRRWHHEHTFVARDGGTLCGDRVTYRPPLGGLLHDLFVAPELRKIFAYRREKMLERFGGAGR